MASFKSGGSPSTPVRGLFYPNANEVPNRRSRRRAAALARSSKKLTAAINRRETMPATKPAKAAAVAA